MPSLDTPFVHNQQTQIDSPAGSQSLAEHNREGGQRIWLQQKHASPAKANANAKGGKRPGEAAAGR